MITITCTEAGRREILRLGIIMGAVCQFCVTPLTPEVPEIDHKQTRCPKCKRADCRLFIEPAKVRKPVIHRRII